MRYKLLSQIVLILIAFVIIFSYVKPTLLSLRDTQDEIFQYTDAINKISQLNQRLSELVQKRNSIPSSDISLLESYLPSSIDDMKIKADITKMAKESGLTVSSLSSEDPVLPGNDVLFEGERIVSDGTAHVDFTVDLSGSYESLKNLIQLLEQNRYPLEIVELTFGSFIESDDAIQVASEDAIAAYTLVLRTYSYSSHNTSSNNSSL